MNRYLLVTMPFLVAACATSSPEPNQSESVNATASSSYQSPQANISAEDLQGTEAVASNDESSDALAESLDRIEDIEAPNVSRSSAMMMREPEAIEPEIVCERMIPTGSNLRVKVCRSQAEIDRNRKTDQKLIDDIKRSTANGASYL